MGSPALQADSLPAELPMYCTYTQLNLKATILGISEYLNRNVC